MKYEECYVQVGEDDLEASEVSGIDPYTLAIARTLDVQAEDVELVTGEGPDPKTTVQVAKFPLGDGKTLPMKAHLMYVHRSALNEHLTGNLALWMQPRQLALMFVG